MTTLGRGDSVFHHDIVVRGMVQADQGACWAMREPWHGTPRGDILPVPWPVIISCPLRRLQDSLGLWVPACRRHGLDHHQTWPLARWCVDPRPIFFKLPGKRTGLVLLHEGLSEVPRWPWQAAIGGAVGSFLTQGAAACEANILAFLQG